MNKDYVDNLFKVSQNGDNRALQELTNYLFNYGRKVAKSLMEKMSIYNITLDDIDDYILFIINYVYTSFSSETKSFFDFAKFVLNKRLTSKLVELCKIFSVQGKSLDETTSDGTSLYELVEDCNCASIPEQISFEEIHLQMSSPKATDDAIEIKKKRVFMLQSAGYNSMEIMRRLRLTEGQYRYIKKLIQKDLESMKLKIELK